MAFTDFCARSGGSNLNSGTRTGSSTVPGTAADFTYASMTWVQSTRTFTRLDAGNFTTDGMAVGDFVSIYPDGSTTAVYIARVTTVGTTTFVTSATAFSGAAPADGVASRTTKLGGAWSGVNAADGFPFNLITNVLTNVAGDIPRINLVNDATYSITAQISMTSTNNGPIFFEGCTSAYGDGGRATIDGGTSGASYILLNLAVGTTDLLFKNFIFQNNGATGTVVGVSANATRTKFFNCVFANVRGSGCATSGNSVTFEQCESYSCNQSNTANNAGIAVNSTTCFIHSCMSHDNSGSNNNGIYLSTPGNVEITNTIADTNGLHGIYINGTTINLIIRNSDSYNNGTNGIRVNNTAVALADIQNCNLIKNGGHGINGAGSGARIGSVKNCGFGSGTQVNTSGTTTGLKNMIEEGSITYDPNVTPWVDPANGDFRVSLAAAKNAGRGTFTQTAASYAGAVGYPDIGACSHLDAGGIVVVRGMNGGMRA